MRMNRALAQSSSWVEAKNIDSILWSLTGILLIGAMGAISALFAYNAYPNTNAYMIILVGTIAIMILYGKYKKIIENII